MLKPYNQYISAKDYPECINPIIGWRAYKNGEFKVFDSHREAKQYSSLTERFISNEVEYKEYFQKVSEINQKAQEEWFKDLREKYSDIPDEIFDLIYSEAYDKGHRDGNDEVANCLIGLAELYYRIEHILNKID